MHTYKPDSYDPAKMWRTSIETDRTIKLLPNFKHYAVIILGQAAAMGTCYSHGCRTAYHPPLRWWGVVVRFRVRVYPWHPPDIPHKISPSSSWKPCLLGHPPFGTLWRWACSWLGSSQNQTSVHSAGYSPRSPFVWFESAGERHVQHSCSALKMQSRDFTDGAVKAGQALG